MKKTIFFIIPALVLLGTGCKKEENVSNEPTTVFIYSAVATPTNSESVTLKNNTEAVVDLTGWTIGDLNNQNAYSIPNGNNIGVGSSITFNASTMGFQINDSDETIYLKNSAGNIVDTWSN